MATQRLSKVTQPERSITLERARRLYSMLSLLAHGPQLRTTLIKRLKLDVRGFYRDLELLRASGIDVLMNGRRYMMDQGIREAISLLPFPDPRLTLADAQLLSKGKSLAHKSLRALIVLITQPSKSK
jgi:predicted DNA-binding transcriptional regulator YafY